MTDTVPPGDDYPVSDRNQVRRAPRRGHYDRETVWRILDGAMVCHIAFVVDGTPYCFPTTHWRIGDRLFWHGAPAGRMLKAQVDGTPVCLTVTQLDSLVLARSGFNHSVDYRSVMCFGTARAVTDPGEKTRALDAMIDRFFPGRNATLRAMKPAELKGTGVIAMDIEEASAKIRDNGLGDEGADTAHPVWAGRIPVRQVLGDAEPSPAIPPGTPLPPDLAGFAPGRSLDEVLVESARAFARTLSATD